MQIGQAGLELIKSFEGYGRKLPDGSCTAYQEKINGKLDIPTIGYGCTVGVKMGDVWTAQQAEDALRAELAKHIATVTRLITIDLNPNEFDALVSFSYNCGGLQGNTLRAINSGDRSKAVAALRTWNKFGGRVCDGLVRRRAAEVALFLKPVAPVQPDFMPQSATPSAEVGKGTVATGSVLAGLTIPTIPSAVSDAANNAQSWQYLADQITGLGKWAITSPLALGIVGVTCVLLWFTSRKSA